MDEKKTIVNPETSEKTVDKPFQSVEGVNGTSRVKKKSNYIPAIATFITGCLLLLIAFLRVRSIRSEVGYSGSEAEIVALPFIIFGAITITASIIIYVVTLIRRIAFSKKYQNFSS